MDHTLLLEVPDDLYKPLVKTAQQTGKSPEALATEWLLTAIRQIPDDPVEKFIGAFHTDVTDWANEHDKYLGKGLIEEKRA